MSTPITPITKPPVTKSAEPAKDQTTQTKPKQQEVSRRSSLGSCKHLPNITYSKDDFQELN